MHEEHAMKKSVAIVGASADRAKFGNKAVRAFVKGGWTVYPVNAKETTIEGLQTYASLADVPQPLTRISMYVPPSIGKKLLPEIASIPHDELFFNPGADEDGIIKEAEAQGLEFVQACSIVDIGLTPDMFPDE